MGEVCLGRSMRGAPRRPQPAQHHCVRRAADGTVASCASMPVDRRHETHSRCYSARYRCSLRGVVTDQCLWRQRCPCPAQYCLHARTAHWHPARHFLCMHGNARRQSPAELVQGVFILCSAFGALILLILFCCPAFPFVFAQVCEKFGRAHLRLPPGAARVRTRQKLAALHTLASPSVELP